MRCCNLPKFPIFLPLHSHMPSGLEHVLRSIQLRMLDNQRSFILTQHALVALWRVELPMINLNKFGSLKNRRKRNRSLQIKLNKRGLRFFARINGLLKSFTFENTPSCSISFHRQNV
mmetsp:Transcript_26747/g.48574  ORF Transcript_26747/g.48574 Transcript_26747/m.48574 type:complete len:117 (-) Transcript_26747:675-1025(-)